MHLRFLIFFATFYRLFKNQIVTFAILTIENVVVEVKIFIFKLPAKRNTTNSATSSETNNL